MEVAVLMMRDAVAWVITLSVGKGHRSRESDELESTKSKCPVPSFSSPIKTTLLNISVESLKFASATNGLLGSIRFVDVFERA